MFKPSMSIAERTQTWLDQAGQPVAELVQWLFDWDEHIVVQKDGSLLANFVFDGVDSDSTEISTINALRGQLDYAYKPMQELPITMWWQVRRRLTTDFPEAQFPDPVSQAIHDSQREAFLKNAQFTNFHTVSLAMEPPANSSRALARIARASSTGGNGGLGVTLRSILRSLRDMVTGNSDFSHETLQDLEDAAAQFEKVLAQFASSVQRLGLRPLIGEQLGGFLTMCVSPTRTFAPKQLPSEGHFWDTGFTVDALDNSHRDHIEISGMQRSYLSSISFGLMKRGKKRPLQLDMFAELMSAPVAFTLTHVFRFQPARKGVSLVAEMTRYHNIRKFPLKAYLAAGLSGNGQVSEATRNEVRADLTDEAQALQDAVEVGHKGVGLWYGGLVVHAQDLRQLETDTQRIENIFNSCQLSPIRETLHKLSTFAATIPGSHDEIARWSKIETSNMVDLAPLLTVSHGEPTCEYLTQELKVHCPALLILPTNQRTPYHFTGYVGDVGHAIILGGTGGGKTTFANMCWTAFRQYPRARVICFDKNYSVRPAILLQGGKYIDLNPESVSNGRARMNPIRGLLEDSATEHIGFLIGWIELLVKQRGYMPSAADRIELERALFTTAQMGKSDRKLLRLSSVISFLNHQTALAQNLMPWIQGNLNGNYFDNEEDDFELTSLVGIENGSILQSDELSAPYMSQAFYRIAVSTRKNMRNQDAVAIQPTFIYIPELRYFLRNKHFEAQLGEDLVTLRKLGVRMFFDTQSPDQLVESNEFAAFRDNLPTAIWTPNDKANRGSLAKIYTEEWGLRAEDLNFIAAGTPKKDYFIKQGELRRRVSVQLTPAQMAYFRSDVTAQRALEKHYFTGDDFGQQGWQQRYLNELTGGKHHAGT